MLVLYRCHKNSVARFKYYTHLGEDIATYYNETLQKKKPKKSVRNYKKTKNKRKP